MGTLGVCHTKVKDVILLVLCPLPLNSIAGDPSFGVCVCKRNLKPYGPGKHSEQVVSQVGALA